MKVNNTSKPVDGLLPVHSMNVRVPNFKRVNLTRSTNRVTYIERFTDYCSTMKQKFSKKGKGGKVLKTPQEKRDAMSHKNQKNQRWKEEKIEEAKACGQQMKGSLLRNS